MGLPRWSTRAVWPWAKGRGQTGTRCQGCSSPRNADLGGQEGSRALGTGGQKTGSGQASWPCPLVSRLCPAAQVPQSEGSCHLLERKGQKSRGSSLFRHLETRLPQHSGEWGPAGNRARGGRPSPGVALLRARVDTHVPARRGAWDRPEPAPAAGAAHVGSHREPTAERSPRGTAFGPEGYISLPKIPSNALGGSAPGERGPAWGSSLGPAG